MLGLLYENGRGVPQDYAAAVSWYRKAAEQGNAKAQFHLGLMYAKVQGVPPDPGIAHMWFNLAAASGDKDAVKARDIVGARAGRRGAEAGPRVEAEVLINGSGR
jgi:TPR repeat protein